MNQPAHRQHAEKLVELGLQIHETTLDCSHFVNSLFNAMGLFYHYEPSRVLYRGSDAFRRIYRPTVGDLIVWPGHVGIVIDPEQKKFVSALRSGVKVASYTSNYWRRKGRPRFLRYRFTDTPVLAWQTASGISNEIMSKSGTE